METHRKKKLDCVEKIARRKEKTLEAFKAIPIEQKKEIRRMEHKLLNRLPKDLMQIYEGLNFKEKLFIPYYFQTQSNTEAAILSGLSQRHAAVRGSQVYRKVRGILGWLEDEIVDKMTNRIVRTSVISREAVLEKLAIMFLADFGDLEDYETAKKSGMIAAAKEIEFQDIKDEEGKVVGSKRVITKMIDQRQVAESIVGILGYKAPAKTEVTGANGQALPPTINVVMNQISSPVKPGDDAIPVNAQVRNRTIQTLE